MVLTNSQQWCNFMHHCTYNNVSIIESCKIQRIIISQNPHILTKLFCKYLYSRVFVINTTLVNALKCAGMAVIPICFMGMKKLRYVPEIPNFSTQLTYSSYVAIIIHHINNHAAQVPANIGDNHAANSKIENIKGGPVDNENTKNRRRIKLGWRT